MGKLSHEVKLVGNQIPIIMEPYLSILQSSKALEPKIPLYDFRVVPFVLLHAPDIPLSFLVFTFKREI